MSSFFGFVVGLLHATLSLFGFVQPHPEFPQAPKDQTEAIIRATQTIQSNNASNNEVSLISLSPTSGPVGTQISIKIIKIIKGKGFAMAGNSIHIGKGCIENVTAVNSTLITFILPGHVDQCHDEASRGTDTQPDDFAADGTAEISVSNGARSRTDSVTFPITNGSASNVSVPGTTQHADENITLVAIEGPHRIVAGQQAPWSLRTLPNNPKGATYSIDWGDGSPQGVQNTPTFMHTYVKAGRYPLSVAVGYGPSKPVTYQSVEVVSPANSSACDVQYTNAMSTSRNSQCDLGGWILICATDSGYQNLAYNTCMLHDLQQEGWKLPMAN